MLTCKYLKYLTWRYFHMLQPNANGVRQLNEEWGDRIESSKGGW
jgi:hypothetical protein